MPRSRVPKVREPDPDLELDLVLVLELDLERPLEPLAHSEPQTA